MIPEQYWIILRHWFWLIGLMAIGGAVAGLLLIHPLIAGDSEGYNARATLGIRRLVTLSGTSTSGGSDILADYTDYIAAQARTPQTIARLRSDLAEDGYPMSEQAVAGKVNVTSDRGLIRVNIEATASTEAQANAIATSMADLLIEQMAAEEQRVNETLSAETESKRTDLLAELSDVYERRLERLNELDAGSLQTALDDLVRRGVGSDLVDEFKDIVIDIAFTTGDSQLAILNSEASSIEAQLGALSEAERTATVGTSDKPVFLLNPVDTVQTPIDVVRRRDLAMLGLIAGAVLGWMAANGAQSLVTRGGRAAAPAQVEAEPEGEPPAEDSWETEKGTGTLVRQSPAQKMTWR